MKKHLILLSFLITAASAFSQPYYLKFVATGAATSLDSIHVKNLKKGTFLSLKGTDELRLIKYVGIQNLNSGQENASVYPCPMQEQAELSFYVKEAGTARITIFDISGKEVAGFSTHLSAGQQKFEIKGMHEGSYVVKVSGDNYQYYEKVLSINNSQQQPVISYSGTANPEVNPVLKATMTIIDMPYTTGDTMRYTGYSGNYVAVRKEVPTSSNTITFLFSPRMPILSTTAVTGITDSTALSGGNVTNDQGFAVTARGVCWSTTTNPVIAGSHTTDGSGKGVFISNITGLTDGTLYYVRAYATSSMGTGYGNEVIFSTPGKPTVTTASVTGRTDSSAVSGGNVISDGSYPVTARGVCWDTAANPDISDNHSTDGTDTGSFISYITGLDSNVTYFVRAYATNSFGTAYGNQFSFIAKSFDTTIGLIAYYPFNGNANDESGIGNDGTVSGATLTTDRFGNPNSAYSFNGSNNYISIPVNINYDTLPQLTMVAWVSPSYIPLNPIKTIISHDNGGYDRTMNIDYRSGTIGYSTFDGNGVFGSFTATIGQWDMITVVYDQTTDSLRLYKNTTSMTGTTSFGSGLNYTWIGGNPTQNEYFDGVIDEVRIYNRVLTPEEIQELYNK